MGVGGEAADVPAVTHREQRQDRDLGVLDGVQRAEQQLEREAVECVAAQFEPDRLRREARGRQLERGQVDLGVVGEPAALVGEHRLGHQHAAEGERHAECLAPVEQPLDQRLGLALGLGVPVAVERLDQRAARVEIELAHVKRAAEVQIDRARVKRRECARELGGAERLPGAQLDDLEGIARR